MAQDVGVKVAGARELRRALKQAGVDVREDIKDAHREVGNIVVSRARALVPVAPPTMRSAVPGLLRDSIRPGATQTAAIVRAGTNKKVPYANPIHWGWHRRHIRPSLFLARAAAETEKTWINEYFDKFDKLLDKVADSTKETAS